MFDKTEVYETVLEALSLTQEEHVEFIGLK
jgi:hypothetical protein